MAKKTFHPALKHLLAYLFFAVVAMLYFYPYTFHGKVIGNQTDRIQSIARQHEVKAFSEKEDRPILWTNAIFSGMPSTLIGGGKPDNFDYTTHFTINIFRFFHPSTVPYALFVGAFLGMYILLLTFKVDWRIGILGGILYGLSTSHLLILEGGHFNKLQNIILCPPFFAAVITLLRGKYIKGGVFAALLGSVMLLSAHVQIIFYFLLILALYVFVWWATERKSEDISSIGKKILVLMLAGMVALLPNIFDMWSLRSYGEQSIRGKTELVESQKPQEGLDKDYAFSWSMGVMESISVLVPDFMGATSGEAFVSDKNSKSLKVLRSNPQANELARYTVRYWGDQPFVGGAYYYGAALFALFVFALFILPQLWVWWSLSSLALIFMLGWGKNFSGLNYFLFDHVPLFNKFRAVNMIFILGHIVIVFIAMLGLNQAVGKEKGYSLKSLKSSAVVSMGIFVLLLLVSFVVDPSGPRDAALSGQDKLIDALKEDRLRIMRGDILRAMLFVGAIFGGLFMHYKNRLSSKVIVYLLPLIALIDIVGITKRYVNDEDFVKAQNFNKIFLPRPVDKQILNDPDIHYRVMDLSSGDPFNTNLSSYHHKLVGGYHPAKIRRYQEVIERYLKSPSEYMHIYNMLNTKYFIVQGGDGKDVVQMNKEALGNAWFVESIKVVNSANEEINAIKEFAPGKVAIMQKRFANADLNMNPGSAENCNIQLTEYIPDHLTYQYSSDKDRLAVFSEIYYPEEKGWKIYIDGKRKEGLKKVNYILNGVELPGGEHILELRFEPDHWSTMLWISRIGALLLGALVIYVLYLLFFRNKKGQNGRMKEHYA